MLLLAEPSCGAAGGGCGGEDLGGYIAPGQQGEGFAGVMAKPRREQGAELI